MNQQEKEREILLRIYRLMAAFEKDAQELSDATLENLEEEIRDQLDNNFGAVTLFDSIRWGVMDTLEYHLGLEDIDEVIAEAYEVILRPTGEEVDPVFG
jgi:hypothetical protein